MQKFYQTVQLGNREAYQPVARQFFPYVLCLATQARLPYTSKIFQNQVRVARVKSFCTN